MSDPWKGRLDGVRDALVDNGWFRATGAVPVPIREALAIPGGDTRWQPLDPQVGQVRMSGWYHQPARADLPAAAVDLAESLLAALHLQLDGLAVPAVFNETSWQRHLPGEHAVTTHRDQSVYTGVIAVITLNGSDFSIYEQQDGPERNGWDAVPATCSSCAPPNSLARTPGARGTASPRHAAENARRSRCGTAPASPAGGDSAPSPCEPPPMGSRRARGHRRGPRTPGALQRAVFRRNHGQGSWLRR